MSFIHVVKKPASSVFDYLADADKMDPARANIYKSGPAVVFTRRMTERFWILFFPYDYSYDATIKADKTTGKISMCLKTQLFLDAKIVFSIKGKGTTTEVRENIVVKGNPLVKRMVRDHFYAVHHKLLSRLEKLNA